jgi:hypothetical protein
MFRVGVQVRVDGGRGLAGSLSSIGSSANRIGAGAGSGSRGLAGIFGWVGRLTGANRGLSQSTDLFRDANGRLHDSMGRYIREQGAATGAANRFGSSLRFFKPGADQALQSVRSFVGGLMNMKMMLVGLLTLAAGGSLFSKIIGSNAELQMSRLSMGAVINANLQFRDSQGVALKSNQNFIRSMKVSTGVLGDLENMAMRLPGTTQDLTGIFRLALNPSLSAGKTIKEIEALSASTMVFAKITGTDMPQASRDLQFMLNGQADSVNKTFAALKDIMGVQSEGFNKLTKAERFGKISAAFKQFVTKEALEEYASSWDGVTSTLDDFSSIALRTFGGPLFKMLSTNLQSGVEWLTKNKESVMATSLAWGTNFVGGIKNAIDMGSKAFAFYKEHEKIINGLTIGIGLVVAGIWAWNAAQIALTLVQNLNPVMLAITAVALGIGLIITHWDQVRPVLEPGLKWLAGAWSTVTRSLNVMLAFVKSIPLRFANAWDGIKIQFLRLGAWLLDTAKRIPVLGILFGIGDQMLGGTAAATANIAAIQGAMDRRALEITAGDPSDPRKQYGASRLLAMDPTRTQGAATANTTNLANSSAKTEVTVHQNITTSDPVVAGNVAAQGVQRSIPKAPNPRVGPPLTALTP